MKMWTIQPLAPFILLLLLVACGGQPPSAPSVARVVVSPASLLLMHLGDGAQLTARAFDANGNPLDVDIGWTSTASDTVTVGADGRVTAVDDLGSSQIVATAGGMTAAAVVVVAQSVEGALLVRDEHVVGTPTPADPDAPYGLGWRYVVTLAGDATPAIGDIIVGTGEIALGGRVVAVEPSAAGAAVTLELVGLDDLFDRLRIEETIALDGATLELTEAAAEHFEATRLSDGSWQFVSRPGATVATVARGPSANLQAAPVGPLSCETDSTALPELKGGLKFVITPHLSVVDRYDTDAGGLQELRLTGSIESEVTFEPQLALAFSGTLTCTVTLGTLMAPLPGPVGLVLGAHIPVGLGFELLGATQIANVGVKMKATTSTTLNYTIYCELDCVEDSFENGATGTFEPVLPNPTEQFRVDLRAFAFAFAKLEIGAHVSPDARLELLGIRAGLAQVIDLAPRSVQVNDANYHSGYRLVLLGTASPGKSIEEAIELLAGSLAPKIGLSVEIPLARSPTGTFTITPATVQAGNAVELGDTATFTVELDPVSYLGAYVVEGVDIVWIRDGELTSGRPGCSSLAAAPNQSTFTCQTDFRDAHEGDQTFYAFVRTSLFGISLPIALEIADDARATVSVDPSDCPDGMTEACEDEEEPSVTVSGWVEVYSTGYFALFDGSGSEERVYLDSLADAVEVGTLAPSDTAEFHQSHFRTGTQEGTTATTDVTTTLALAADLSPSGGTLQLDIETDASTSMSAPPPGKGAFASSSSSTHVDITITVVGPPASFTLNAIVVLDPPNSEYSYPTRISLGDAFEKEEFPGSGTVSRSGPLEPGTHRLRIDFGPETGREANTNVPLGFPAAQEGSLEFSLVVSQ